MQLFALVITTVSVLVGPAEDRGKPHSVDGENRPAWFDEPGEPADIIATSETASFLSASDALRPAATPPAATLSPMIEPTEPALLPPAAVDNTASGNSDEHASTPPLRATTDASRSIAESRSLADTDPDACVTECVRVLSLCDRSCRDWTAEIGVLALVRRRPDTDILITDPGNPSRRLDSNEFAFGLQTGVEFALTNHRGLNGLDFEIRYFRIDDWSNRQSLRINTNPIQINNNPPLFLSGPRAIVSRYGSEIQNMEWTVRKPVGRGTNLLLGARHLRIDERLQTRFRSLAVPAISTEDYFVRTRNRLYGLQIGLDSILSCGPSHCLEVYSKAGIFSNQAEQTSVLVNYLNPPVVFSDERRDGDIGFIGELGLKSRVQLSKNTSFVAGYRGLLVDGLALASEQVTRTNFAGLSGIKVDGSAFYHGGTFGLEIWF